jgi:hypothetical protein
MIDFQYKPFTFFTDASESCLLAKLTYPESQWGEIIFIYAHKSEAIISLEACDFYGNEILIQPKEVTEPLKLEELIRLIETLTVEDEDENYKFSLKYSGIPEVESVIYKDLEVYFEEKRKTFGLL